MAKLNLPDIGSLANNESARQAINDNFTAIEEAIENTLSRDGDVPNQMDADLDLNGNKVLNVADPTADADAVNYRSVRGLVETFMGEIAQDQIEGTARVETFTATSGQTEFQLADSPGFVQNMYVFDDGVALVPGVDFTLTGADLKTLEFFVGRTIGHEILVRYTELAPTDGLLRADLVSPAADKGSYLLADKQNVAGAVLRTQRQKNSDILSVKDFGAVGDGVTDDTAAFNAMSAYAATKVNTTNSRTTSVNLFIPPGEYSLSSWDLTDLTGRQVNIYGMGAVLIANTANKNVVDCVNSRWLRFHGLTIYSSAAVEARSGIQLGPNAAGTACGNNLLDNVFIIGHFAVAPYMNLGSETTECHSCNFVQLKVSTTIFAAVMDGASVYLPTSDYVTITRAPGDLLSFTNCYHGGGTQFRNEGGASGVYLGKTEGFTFDSSCYALSFNQSAFVVHNTGTVRNKGLTVNCQFENSQDDFPTPGNIGIRYAFTFTGDSNPTAIEGFRVDTFAPQCEEYFIRNLTGSTLRISNAYLRMAGLQNSGAVWFSAAGGLSIDGEINCQEASKLNLGVLSSFNGILNVNDYTALASVPVAGAFVAIDRTNNQARIMGKTKIYDYTSGSAIVEIGNSSGNYVGIQGSSTNPIVKALGTSTDIDLRLQGKGTGLVRFGTATGNADAPIIGYIQIKDDGGTIRKIPYIA